MQTNLEVKAIKKRAQDDLVNVTRTFGPKGDEVTGNDSAKEYDINGKDARKGGTSIGSISDHLTSFDLSTGGSKTDSDARAKQQSYVIPGLVTYNESNIYSDANINKIDTSLNVGQVVIY